MEKTRKVDKLSRKRAAFCWEYTKDKNGTQAAIRAGYSEKSAQEQASDLLSVPMVREAIDELLEEQAAHCNVTAIRVVTELAGIGFNKDAKDADRVSALKELARHMENQMGAAMGLSEQQVKDNKTVTVELVKDAMSQPTYLEYLRERAVATDGDPGHVRADGERRQVANGAPSGGH